MNRSADDSRPVFTPKQGQYLAFIHAYTLVNGRPPAEADMMRFFRVTPPTVHQMVLTLEQAGLISRRPGVARSIAILLDRSDLPQLDPGHVQPVKITVTRYSHVRHFKMQAQKFRRSSLELFSIAAAGQGRRHDHETTVDHALIRGLATAGPVMRRGASSV
jgi:SOS-response transcriptional repressor LexA